MRHSLDAGVDPSEVRRRVGRVRVDLLGVLDLTDDAVWAVLDLTDTDLVGDDYVDTQAVSAAAVAASFGGLLAPPAALPGRRTLVVFPAGAAAITEEHSAVRQPPPASPTCCVPFAHATTCRSRYVICSPAWQPQAATQSAADGDNGDRH